MPKGIICKPRQQPILQPILNLENKAKVDNLKLKEL
jgi:hypothetical protein